MRYIAMAEAEEQFGFDPAAERAGVGEDSGPVVTPRTPRYEWWGCEWDAKADNPHVTDGEASVRGCWLYKSGDCPARADVTVTLQALGCSTFGCTWITQATATATAVTPGSGTGHWATPHRACANSNLFGWQGRRLGQPCGLLAPLRWKRRARARSQLFTGVIAGPDTLLPVVS